MQASMVHRGPDGEGLWVAGDGMVGLAHRRLSIIDLSEKASQPMQNETGDILITYNGEIYNHLEIRAELMQRGHQFFTDGSDTETIIKAYEQWGVDSVQRFRGMFAFGLWDDRRQSLFLARDPFGIKPLYHGWFNDHFYFASEIKAILEDPIVPREVNEKGLYDFLSFMCVPAPETLFKGIEKLPAGHAMLLDREGTRKVWQYWEVFDDVRDLEGYSEEAIACQLLSELEESVKYHGLADVPVGVFLSGGIDSSCNAVLFDRNTDGQIKTFTTGFSQSDSYDNEFQFARQVANQIRSDHHEVTISPEMFLSFLPDLIKHQDEPIADPVCVPVYFVSKLASDNNIKVCQVGEGSDELFWGYPIWKKHLYLDRYKNNPLVSGGLTLLNFFLNSRKSAGKVWVREYIRRAANREPSFWTGAECYPESLKSRIISQDFKKRLGGYSSYTVVANLRERFLSHRAADEHLAWMTYSNLKLRLPELLLMRVDKMSMAVSLETRVPFLDKKFVSYAMSIPENLKTKNGELKHVLKRAVKNIIPHELIHRKKQGFGAPVTDFYRHGLGKVAREMITEFVATTDYFDPQNVNNFIMHSGSAGFWYFLNLACWHKAYIRQETLQI